MKMVRAGGLEPPRAYAQQILSLVCLPFHHARNHVARRPMSKTKAMCSEMMFMRFKARSQAVFVLGRALT